MKKLLFVLVQCLVLNVYSQDWLVTIWDASKGSKPGEINIPVNPNGKPFEFGDFYIRYMKVGDSTTLSGSTPLDENLEFFGLDEALYVIEFSPGYKGFVLNGGTESDALVSIE